MFDLVHKYKKFMVLIIFLIALSFVFWGVENRVVRGGADVVATVDGLEITVREFEEALRRQQEQLRQIFGGQIDPAMLDTPESRRALLDSLIDQRLVAAAAADANLTVTDEALRDAILSMQVFHGPDGQFSRATYESLLRQQNPPLTPTQFEAQMRRDLATAQLSRAVAEATIPSRAVAQRLAAIEAQTREVAESHLPAKQFAAQVKIGDDEIKGYYDANQAQFRTPERVRADYVVLSGEELAAQETVKPEEVREEWERAYGAQIQSREAALKRAQAIAAQVRQEPGRFAELARQESQDPGSREAGGDLGFAPRGSFVKPFEEAVFRMREGEVSGVVESEFGFHIIQLTGIRKAEGREERRASHILIEAPMDAKPFEQMREQVAAELRRQRAARRFAEAADTFNNLAWEQPESLDPLVERFKLKVQRSDWITRAGGEEAGLLDAPRLLTALFSANALERKRNTDAIEVAPNTVVVARVAEHQPAAQRSFEEVRERIAEFLRRREAAALAHKEGAARLERLRQGEETGVQWSAVKSVSRRDPQGVPSEVLRPVMSADVSALPAYVGVPLGDEGYLLLRISKVVEPDLKEEANAAVSRAAQVMGTGQYQAYVASLREQARIRVNQRSLEKR
jgi:peptidyl-prolyl cis-trans isomerase D